MADAETVSKLHVYYYQPVWEEDYFVVASGETCTCLICGYVFRINKKYNVERHYNRYHIDHNVTFPKASDARRSQIQSLESKVKIKTLSAPSPKLINNGPYATTMLSFKIAFVLAKAMKPFEDGTIAKKLMTTAAEELLQDGEFKDNFIAKINKLPLSSDTIKKRVENISTNNKAKKPFGNGDIAKQLITTVTEELLPASDFKDSYLTKIDEIPLSRKTITRRVREISNNVTDQLTQDLQNCKALSLQFDKSTDGSDPTQLCVFVRMVFDDCTVTEEFLSIIPLKKTTTGNDIITVFKYYLGQRGALLKKVVSVTTHPTSATVDPKLDILTLCKCDPDFSPVITFHCIIHQLSLCAESLDVTHVLQPVTKIIDLIRTEPSQQKLFKPLLDEANCKALLPDTEFGWLCKRKVLDQFYKALPEIKQFLESGSKSYVKLENQTWLQDLAFFIDLARLIIDLTLRIQCKNIPIWTFVSQINCFREKITMWIEFFLLNNVPTVFEKLKKTTVESDVTDNICGERFAKYLQTIDEEFERWFRDYRGIQMVAKYLHAPYLSLASDSAEIASTIVKLFTDIDESTVRSEIIELRHDDRLYPMIHRSDIKTFWRNIDQTRYESLVIVFTRLLSCFGSKFLCEKMFTTMKHVKSKLKSRLTDKNLDGLLRISVSEYLPDFHKLTESSNSQVSH